MMCDHSELNWDRKKMNVWIYKHHKSNHNPFNGAATTTATAVAVKYNRLGRKAAQSIYRWRRCFCMLLFISQNCPSPLTHQNKEATTILLITSSFCVLAFLFLSLSIIFICQISFILLLLLFSFCLSRHPAMSGTPKQIISLCTVLIWKFSALDLVVRRI